MAQQIALTTKDNPYDPLDQFDLWYEFDVDHGYNTCSYIARLYSGSPADSEVESHEELERVINEIIELNITGNYIKIIRDS